MLFEEDGDRVFIILIGLNVSERCHHSVLEPVLLRVTVSVEFPKVRVGQQLLFQATFTSEWVWPRSQFQAGETTRSMFQPETHTGFILFSLFDL